jgi:rhomboid protease GluP
MDHGAVGSAGADSFARYLAKVLVAKHGYREGTVPEAEGLARKSELVLTKADGITISLICIVDAERDPSRRFGLERGEVIAIAKACRDKYSGTVNGQKMPAIVEIIEVRSAVTEEDKQRLKPLRSRIGAAVYAFAVDLSAATVTVNSWSFLSGRHRSLERLLRTPRLGDSDLVRPAPAALPDATGQPILTYLLLAGLLAAFVVELIASRAAGGSFFKPDLGTLIALGALSRPLVLEHGEWYRLFTAVFLHADLLHLAFNGIALWMGGLVLEHLLGRAWLFLLFFAGALGGSLMSVAINRPEVVSVGASGAIMSLLATALVVAFRFPQGPERMAIFSRMLGILLPSVIPLASVRPGARIDFAAHIGGALVGFVFAAIAMATWPRTAVRPRFTGAAMGLALLGAVVFAWSGRQAYAGYATYALERLLIPKEMLPKTDQEITAKAEALVTAYPRDPRSHLYRAFSLMHANDPGAAEAELRRGLAEKDLLQTYFSRELEVMLRSVLAQTLMAQNRREDARAAVKPVCDAGPGGGIPARLKTLGLCP